MMKYIVSFFMVIWCFSFVVAQKTQIDIVKHWQFKQTGKSKWHTSTVPGTVHTDLLQHQLIPDPFFGTNESKLQWISHVDWEYQTIFKLDAKTFSQKHKILVFEGLDTYAEVYLNGKQILSTDNMFRTWRVDVSQLIQSTNNQLHIIFKSAHRMADSLAALSPIKYPCENNRNVVRKAQYHFGWDFAPKLTTCGIWRKVRLEAWDDEMSNTLPAPKKSWNVSLVQEKDSIGQSFYFTVNGKPTFIKGANWVPADVFLPRITAYKYRKLLIAAKAAGIDMLRVWGGGIYEADIFYELCDSLGIMVWQDFMFAGAMYPGDSKFVESVKQEVNDNVQRLSKHPCIVLWCGNNEIDEAWHNWGWQKQYRFSPADSTQIWNDYKNLFHDIIPTIVAQYSQQPYITTSPLNGWGRKESMTHGDSHYWGVWWGLQPIETYEQKIPRFMSEYGMQSLPNFESIQQFAQPKDWDTSSAVMKAHQKHPTGYQTLATYLQQNKLKPTHFKQYISATQQVQAKAMEIAINAHLKAQPYCMGTLFWQFNDCWPGASWSVVDYYGRKKKAYFTVQKWYRK
jgi:beta-mannosidase